MALHYRAATPADLERCTDIRGKTRDNPIDKQTLLAIGVTTESWTEKMNAGHYIGCVAEAHNEVVAYCFGDTASGEILVLAVLAEFDGQGIGSTLLKTVVRQLFDAGWDELWLAASATDIVRAYGFYRHLGWQPTQTYDVHGDEILRLRRELTDG